MKKRLARRKEWKYFNLVFSLWRNITFCSKHIKPIKVIKANLSEVRFPPAAALPVV